MTPGKVCDVKMSQDWKPCLEEYGFGFGDENKGPCIFLKLNKVGKQIGVISKF